MKELFIQYTKQRMNILFIFFLFFSFAILFTFANIQIPSYMQTLRDAASLEGIKTTLQGSAESYGERGEIFLKNKASDYVPFAVNKDFFLIYVEPNHITEKEKTARILAETLFLSYETVIGKISKVDDPYEVIARHVPDNIADVLREQNMRGVGMQAQVDRYYPFHNIGAHIAGFLGTRNNQRIGQYGVEGFYEEILRNTQKDKQVEKIVLSVDPDVQSQITDVLTEAIRKWDAISGSVIVMDPISGAILGMANYPEFDPNIYAQAEDISVFSNVAISGQYELGSVFKPITMAMALNEGVVTPETTYQDKGRVVISGYVINNVDSKAYGEQNMTQVLEKSLNTGMIFVSQKMEKKIMRDYIKKFGFGEKTNISLGGEVGGDIRELENNRDVRFANASFGHGIAITPLQLINAISAIANGGMLMEPHIVNKIFYTDDSVDIIEPHIIRKVITKDTSETLTKMLVSTVDNGYSKVNIPKYFVAGKTGTAYIPNKNKRGYSEETIHSFVGYAPAYKPRFSVFVTINSPQGVRFASKSLAPVFSDIMSYLLAHYEIPPDF